MTGNTFSRILRQEPLMVLVCFLVSDNVILSHTSEPLHMPFPLPGHPSTPDPFQYELISQFLHFVYFLPGSQTLPTNLDKDAFLYAFSVLYLP